MLRFSVRSYQAHLVAQRQGIFGHYSDTKRNLSDGYFVSSVIALTVYIFGAPEEILTPDPQIRSLVLHRYGPTSSDWKRKFG